MNEMDTAHSQSSDLSVDTNDTQEPPTINMDDTELGGGIQDDDLSEGMMQDWEEAQTAHRDLNSPPTPPKLKSPQHHPVVRSKDNKAKQC